MKVEILKTNPYVIDWRGVQEDVEADGKKIFDLTMEEYADFVNNQDFYKIKTKKLYFDEAYKKKIESEEEEDKKAQKKLNLRIELCSLKEQEEKFIKYNIVTEELENKILNLENRIKDLGGEPYIKEETEEMEGKNE